MNLCIDQGNSSTKIGLFEKDNLVHCFTFTCLNIETLKEIFKRHTIENAILCSVTNSDTNLLTFLHSNCKLFINLDHHTKVPIVNHYQTPETLGKDRLAAVVGACYLKPASALLIIDAGTAITYDVVDEELNYWGGNISPGIQLRLRALHEFTKKLPMVEAQQTEQLLGNNTSTAILSGVMQGIVFEMNGYIDTIKIKYPQLSVFLTGGSTFYFDTKLKNTIFAEKNLVLIGINRILQYNVQI